MTVCQTPTPDLSPQEALTTAKALDPVPGPKTRPRGSQGPAKGHQVEDRGRG